MGVSRQDVERVAEELFSQKGYAATSMADIAERLGIQRGSLYAHITSKEELLYAIVQRAANEFEAETRAAFDASLPPEERLRLAVRGHMRVIARHSHGFAVFLTEWRFLTGERLEAVLRLRDQYEELFREILAEGVRIGRFQVADATVARMAVLSVLNWAHQWYRPGGRLAPEEAADHLTELLLTGLMGGLTSEAAARREGIGHVRA